MENYEMVAKTLMGLEDVLAEELRNLGAVNVEPGKRMVSFEGDLEMMYRANLCCRTALRILKPFYKFMASDPDELYDMVKEYDWSTLLNVDKTFSVETTVNSEEFTHSRYVVYRVKDAIVDYFKDRYGENARPGVCLHDADLIINVHIMGNRVTLSLDSSGESLHKRGYRVAQTEAPINEVLAAGIILKSGWRGDCPLVDPMCGSGTFLIEAAMIGANIMPGVYRRHFAFETWEDFDRDLFDRLYNDDSGEREFSGRIIGSDVSGKAVAIARENIKSAGVGRFIDIEVKDLADWEEAPANGVLVTNPPYGERINVEDMEGLYRLIGTKLKHVFKGYHAWIIGYRDEYMRCIGLSPSFKETLLNGSLECELREYVIFDGDYKSFRRDGGSLRDKETRPKPERKRIPGDREWKSEARRKGVGGKGNDRPDRKPFDRKDSREGGFDRRPFDRKSPGRFGDKPGDRKGPGRFDRKPFQREPLSAEEEKRMRFERALRSVVGKKPSLPPTGHRRGWKKGDNNDNDE